MKPEWVCYSCMKMTDDFYVNGKTGKKAAYCSSCSTEYTPKERKMNVIKNTIKILGELK